MDSRLREERVLQLLSYNGAAVDEHGGLRQTILTQKGQTHHQSL